MASDLVIQLTLNENCRRIMLERFYQLKSPKLVLDVDMKAERDRLEEFMQHLWDRNRTLVQRLMHVAEQRILFLHPTNNMMYLALDGFWVEEGRLKDLKKETQTLKACQTTLEQQYPGVCVTIGEFGMKPS